MYKAQGSGFNILNLTPYKVSLQVVGAHELAQRE